MIEILNSARLERARDTGALVGNILHTLKQRSTVGTNLLDIDQWAKEMITEAGAQSCYVDYAPSFGRGPFGHYICTAVNDGVLHGRPHNYTLADGDLLTLDLAVARGGVAADAAISFLVGKARPAESVAMIETTERALAAGIAAAKPGARIGDLSHAIGTVLSKAGYPINTEFEATASARPCTRTHTSRTPDGPAADTSCAPDCCSPWSPGSWPTLPPSSPTPTVGRCAARQAAGPRTASTPSPSPTAEPKFSPDRKGVAPSPPDAA